MAAPVCFFSSARIFVSGAGAAKFTLTSSSQHRLGPVPARGQSEAAGVAPAVGRLAAGDAELLAEGDELVVDGAGLHDGQGTACPRGWSRGRR